MSIKTLTPAPAINYSLEMIRDEARQLIEQGIVSRQQPIYVLCQYIPTREWVYVKYELEKCDYLLRDRIGDLVASEVWNED